MYLHELSGSKFHSVTSSNVILYKMLKTQFSSKVDLSGFGNELFNCVLGDYQQIVYLSKVVYPICSLKMWDWIKK